ncbi:hypothetical protein C2845_PM07G12580 [Panicum miliaceum]|uniref:F-box associated beta-propeller type 3 domain-containing protein n=1 Tax=Panicum miliaceum TaxID=4540 RepID=A0A3L6SGG6_PANMI|nr:hypothetical protein C2845_PM07G12580 [Panicum miliaceum]
MAKRRSSDVQQAMAKKRLASAVSTSSSAPRFLPDDVVGEVLLRLPSKSLASHHALAAAKRPTKFAFAPTAPPHRWNLFEDHDVRCRECPRVIGPKPCRGLVLLGQRCTRTYSVCNPSTGGRLRLPPCLTGYPYFKSCAEIGFDERAGVHKVAVIAAPIELEWAIRCEVITIGNPASWRAPAGEESSSMPDSFLVQNMDPVFANGCLHWALRGVSRFSESDSAVLSFSLAGESFRRVPLMTTWFVVPLCYLAGDGDSSDRIMLRLRRWFLWSMLMKLRQVRNVTIARICLVQKISYAS